LQKSIYDELDDLNRKIGTLALQEVFSIARKTLADLADVSLEERMTNMFIRRLHDMNDKQIAELNACLHSSSSPAVVRSAFELASPQKTAIEDTFKPLFGEDAGIKFETRPNLIGGIELAANGQKIAWSIADYLTSLTSSVGGLLEPKVDPAPDSKKAIPHAR
jgi:F-type H+-transporting ATPase subunit b